MNQEYAVMMARYNAWQNQSLLASVEKLSQEERRKDRGAFFGSIEQTFSHLLWGDEAWMSRFAGLPMPEGGIAASNAMIPDWAGFTKKRREFDGVILDWAKSTKAEWFEGDLTWYSGSVGHDVSKPKALLVVHFFNHQTHHRGQIHAMVTAAGAKTTATDLAFLPEG